MQEAAMGEAMTYSVNYDDSLTAIHATIAGIVNINEMTLMSVEIVAIAKQHGCRSTLIDFSNAIIGISIFATFNFITHLEEIGVKRSDNVALVFSQGRKIFEIAEMAARNGGWPNVHFFTDHKEAEDWLKMKSIPGSSGKLH
jgi:hypothetical protein